MGFFELITPDEVQTVATHPGASAAGGPSEPPAVSVVIAIHNGARWLSDLLEALYRLQPPDGGCEFILVDDGSDDGTDARLRALASRSPWPLTALRLRANRGRAIARNAGILRARGQVVAFTDADCLPHPGWLRAALPHFEEPTVGIVQGRTLPPPGSAPPLLSHFMEVTAEDGHYATCNICYRRQALLAAGGFDPTLAPNGSLLGTWEDVDMGWRVLALGWRAVFEPEALVYHQVIPLTWRRWLSWPIRLGRRPEIVARYPAYRRFLHRRLWVDPVHARLTLALLGLAAAWGIHPGGALLALPYLHERWRRRPPTGRWPTVKLALHIAWDLIGFASLLTRSVRFGTLVL